MKRHLSTTLTTLVFIAWISGLLFVAVAETPAPPPANPSETRTGTETGVGIAAGVGTGTGTGVAAPVISPELRARFWRTQAEAVAAASRAKQSQEAAKTAQDEMAAICGKDFQLTIDQTGEPACQAKQPVTVAPTPPTVAPTPTPTTAPKGK